MKQNFCKIIACCAAVLLSACDKSGDLPGSVPGSDSIILDFSPGAAGTPRAPGVSGTSGASGVLSRSVADNETESRVEHIDVLIFDEGGTKKHYERIDTDGTTSGGTEVLTAKRGSFTADAKYWVYLIANGNDEEQHKFAAEDFDRTALLGMKRTDRYLHLTGLPLENSGGVALPQTFLMDGVAYPSPNKEPTVAEPVVLNNGNRSENTYLAVTLRRAAVKLVLKIKPGERITFMNYGTETGVVTTGGYYMRNMPYTTLVVGGNEDVQVCTTKQSRNRLYQWTPEQITVTTYVYSHSWEHSSAIEREPRWILDIPLAYNNPDPDPDQEGEPAETQYYDKGNYYQIPVCNSPKLERNTCYTISLTLSVPGGTNPSEPVKLQEFSYEVAGWDDQTVDIGGDDERPIFLTVNRTEIEMHNINKDETTLRFASSSAVTATVTAAYYYNKFGQLTQVSSDILNQIKLTPDPGVSGKITIESPVPTNKTIRYIEIEVNNEDGVEARKVLIKQYPLEYITNIQSWYSYRDDFHRNETTPPTTWEYAGDQIVGISHEYERYYDYNDREYKYRSTYTYNTSSSGFWRSKVAESQNSDGSSRIDYYYYRSGSRQTSLAESDGNARMYHVRLEATSSEYTIGRPRLNENGYTDGGADNAKLVSPSFMIASRLGYLNTTYNIDLSDERFALDVVREHCARYVEVYRVKKIDENGKETYEKHILDDWRLPTNAELKIIMDFQGTQNQNADAIDYLLNAAYYWSARERVSNDKSSTSGTSVRCIRDAYDPTAGNQ